MLTLNPSDPFGQTRTKVYWRLLAHWHLCLDYLGLYIYSYPQEKTLTSISFIVVKLGRLFKDGFRSVEDVTIVLTQQQINLNPKTQWSWTAASVDFLVILAKFQELRQQ